MAFISRSRRTELLSFEHVKREFDKGKANDLPANFILKDGQFSYKIIRQRDDRGPVFKIIAKRTIFSLESIQHCNSRTHEYANKLNLLNCHGDNRSNNASYQDNYENAARRLNRIYAKDKLKPHTNDELVNYIVSCYMGEEFSSVDNMKDPKKNAAAIKILRDLGRERGIIPSRGLFVAQDLDDKSKPAESKPAESKPVESKPVESKPVESKPVESKPVESKPVESKPVESKPVESKHLQFRSRNPQRVDNSAKNMHDQL